MMSASSGACTHTHTHAYTHAHTHTHNPIHSRKHPQIHLPTRIHVYVHSYTHTYTQSNHTPAQTHMHTQSYVLQHTHTCTHTNKRTTTGYFFNSEMWSRIPSRVKSVCNFLRHRWRKGSLPVISTFIPHHSCSPYPPLPGFGSPVQNISRL